jgi:DNA (cytosine-5)-methyltransferase 1
MNKMTPRDILKRIYERALKEFEKDSGDSFIQNLNDVTRERIKLLAYESDKQKAVITALITSLVKKIETPSQDIRYHKTMWPEGYSARSYDTRYITPFLKEFFPKIAMKESGWLTRSIEQPHPFFLDFPGKIQNKEVKTAFLQILDDVENKNANPEQYLTALFIFLIKKVKQTQKSLFPSVPKLKGENITIDVIVLGLKEHFFKQYHAHGASKLPVIAIYSIYQLLIKEVLRYQNKTLKPLRSHISPDLRAGGIGDIEIVDENDEYFEAVEIKHNISINYYILKDTYEKIKKFPIKRFYLLTTAEPNIKEEDKRKVEQLVNQIKTEHGCEVIINGLLQSIKYYLRLIKNPMRFLEIYTKNLQEDFKITSELKEEHILAWKKISENIFKLIGESKS